MEDTQNTEELMLSDDSSEESTQAEETALTTEEEDTGNDKKFSLKRLWEKLKKKKVIVILIIIAIVVAGTFVIIHKKQSAKKNAANEIQVTVERKDIKNTVSGSSVIQPKDSYNVTAMVTGEITADTFSEGDVVKKNDILYQIDSETVQQSVQTAQNALVKSQNALVKAQQSYQDALKSKGDNSANNSGSIATAKNALDKAQRSYNDSLTNYNDLSVTSTLSGTVSEVFVKEGDTVQNGSKIASVYSDKYMKLQVPFNEDDAAKVTVGAGATVTVAGTGDEIWGSVTAVASANVATDSHAVVRYVTIELENPGALTTSDKATAVVNGVASNDVGTFEYINTATITAKASGTVSQLGITAKDSVYNGQVVAVLESDSMDTTLNNALDAVEDAQVALEKTIRSSDGSSDNSAVLSVQIALNDAKLSIEDSKLSVEKAKKNLEDYTIKAPIDGTVVTKNKKKGDKLESGSAAASSSSGNSSAMAVIYDLSSLKLQLDVDETEVKQVAVGQSVSITADALEDKTFTGTVTKVGIDGTSSNGVTTYPIDVEITDYGELLPGMNVTAEIVVQEVKNVLAIPVSSLQRGDVVYVKGEKEDKSDNAPDGYKSVKVVTGINDEDYIEIKSGLTEGQELKGIEIQQTDGMQQMMQGGMGDMGGGPPGGGGGGAPGGGGPGGGPGGGGGGPR